MHDPSLCGRFAWDRESGDGLVTASTAMDAGQAEHSPLALLIQTITCCWLVHYAASVYLSTKSIIWYKEIVQIGEQQEYYEPVNVYYAIGGMKLITDGWVWLVGCFDANIFLHTTTFHIIVRMVDIQTLQLESLRCVFLNFYSLSGFDLLVISHSHTFPSCLYFCRLETSLAPRSVYW